MLINPHPDRQKGVSLIELIMFMVIVGVGIAGILSVMNITTQHSEDPVQRKQALAIAEGMLEEVSLQPFTYCAPTDANALTATSVANCAGVAGIPSEDVLPSTSRVSNNGPRDANNVADYNNFSMTPILDVGGTQIAGLASYSVSVVITQVGDTLTPAMTKNDVLQIDVRAVSGHTNILITGYRFRYAPNAIP
ncbi:prepilin-type N-terminal cleavage/methylation domain-containing protein [Glaciimonas sp. PAMC28666]|uniref:type IV pilus modification PilV family protein n=1 Tax=Glaciimonas sp. PAMC28666 TaxID=2807626 RepID=UPI001966A67A|nr:prepilin-type N-terminal cleavage/methylation domain-containing protein [Glaciimonas sp. PAMC28666]QRX82841.1 prepilin-type N-terminal cleavage/methylation domain-containing protein [Glaciimonas sp. PAMC28666]